MQIIELEDRPNGVLLPVRAQPKSRANEFRGVHAPSTSGCVTAAPENGKANAAIVELLCDKLSLRKTKSILHRLVNKLTEAVSYYGVAIAELQKRLTDAPAK